MTVEKASTLSNFSTFAQASVDMSIDLLEEYYPFIIYPFISNFKKKGQEAFFLRAPDFH